MSPIDSILLLAFGGPTRPEEIRPFMDNVVRGKRVPKERYELVVQQYEEIGGSSPFNRLTLRQGEALKQWLEREGPPLPVYLGFRHWNPYINDTLKQMAQEGCKRAVVIVLSPFRSEASWDVYLETVAEAQRIIGSTAPQVDFVPPWGLHPLYIETMAERLKGCSDSHVIFTTHSIPVEMSRGAPYASQFQEAARQIAVRAGLKTWSIAFQSRSGRPEDPWLEPDIRDEIRRLAAKGIRRITVTPIGFVADHAEILYDLDILAAGTARESGVTFHRAEAANDHPLFIRMLAQLVQAHAS